MTLCQDGYGPEQALLYRDGGLESAAAGRFEGHLAGCDACRGILEDEVAIEGLVERAVADVHSHSSHDELGTGDPARFARVRERLLGAGAVTTESPVAPVLKLRPSVAAVLAAAVIVLGVSLILLQDSSTRTVRTGLIAASDVQQAARDFESRFPEFFVESQRGNDGESRLFAVPSAEYPDLDAVLAVAQDGDRVLFNDPTPFLAQDREGLQFVRSHPNGRATGVRFGGGTLDFLVFGRSTSPFEIVQQQAPVTPDVLEVGESVPDSVFVSVTLNQNARVRVLGLTPEGRLTEIVAEPFTKRWWPGRAGTQVLPPLEPLVERLDTGELLRADQLGDAKDVFVVNQSLMYVSESVYERKLRAVPIHVMPTPLGMRVEPGSSVVIVTSPGSFELASMIDRFHDELADLAGGGAADRARALATFQSWLQEKEPRAELTRIDIGAD